MSTMAFQGFSAAVGSFNPWSLMLSLGLKAASSLLTDSRSEEPPQQSPDQGGARIGDLDTQGSSYGLAIPVIYGRQKVAGNLLFLSPIQTQIRTSSRTISGGKGGGSRSQKVTITYYTYTVDVAFALCKGSINSVRRIWVDGQIFLDPAIKTSSSIKVYKGSESQQPDPTLEAHFGVGKTPAFRGLAYVVINNFVLFKNSRSPINAHRLPTFQFEVDGLKTTIHNYSVTRENETDAYTPTYWRKPAHQYCYDALYYSPFRFISLKPDDHSFIENEPVWSYDQIQADMKDIAASYGNAEYDTVGYSVGGREIGALRLFDDGNRPIVGFSQGIHGDERDAAQAFSLCFRRLLDSGYDDPVYNFIRENLTVYFIGTVNPDGMASTEASTFGGSGIRNNGNNVNLNRNWPYYWEVSPDTDKGSEPASENEPRAIIAWMEQNERVQRCISWLDIHGWNSLSTWGFLSEQIYHDIEAQRTQRATFLYIQELMRKRDWGDFSFEYGTPYPREYRSARKPYIYTWIINAAARYPEARNVWGGIFEYPQRESNGSACVGMLDFVKGVLAGACDAIQSRAGGAVVTPAYAPINDNGHLTAWDDANERPTSFTINGLRLTHFPTKPPSNTRSFVRSYRPEDVGWTHPVAGGGYALTSNVFYVVGGYNNEAVIFTSRSELLSSGKKIYDPGLPVKSKHGAMTTDGQYLYFVGGWDDVYHATIWRAKLPSAEGEKISNWQAWHSLSEGIQRHTVDYWNGYLIITGGRTEGGYQSAIRLLNISTKQETILAHLPSARGWHTSTVHNDTLFIFGGWSGFSTRYGVYKVDLNSGEITQTTSLPYSRAQQGIAVHDDIAYLCSGRTGSSKSSKIFWYDLDDEIVGQLDYDLIGGDGNESTREGSNDSAPDIIRPAVLSPACFVHPTDGWLGIIGGESSDGVEDRFWFVDLGNKDMYLRQTESTHWGYLRIGRTFYGNPGESYSVNVAVRNADSVNDARNPYVRITVLIGPLSNISRKLRQAYTVPPQESFFTFTIPFILQAGESEFRIYLRHYGGGTSVDIGAFQVVSTPWSGFIVPSDGKGADRYQVTFRNALNNPHASGITYDSMRSRIFHQHGKNIGTNSQSVSGMFSPIWGSQQVVNDLVILDFDCHQSMDITRLQLIYTGWEDYSNGIPNSKYPSLVAYPATGRLWWRWTIYGNEYSVTVWENFELNHARLNREWRRDVINWKVKTYRGIITLYCWFYGRLFKKEIVSSGDPDGNFTAASIYITGVHSTATGAVMRASRNLGSIVQDISKRAGLTSEEINTTSLAGSITGFTLANQSNAKAFLDSIRAGFFFDVIESGNEIKFLSRGRSSVAMLSKDDLILQDGVTHKVLRKPESELPNQVSVTYIEESTRFQQNTQSAIRASGEGFGIMSVTIAVVMNADQARQIAEKLLYSMWMERTVVEFSTTQRWLYLEPADVITLNVETVTFTLLIISKTEGADGSIRFKALEQEASTYNSLALGGTGPTPEDFIPLYKATILHLLDIPLLREEDNIPGFYIVVSYRNQDPGSWPGCSVFRSTDGGNDYVGISNATTAATIGTASTALPSISDPNIWDRKNSVTVVLEHGELESVTEEAVLNGANTALIGNEIIQFVNALFVAEDTYELSVLLRGRRGSEWAMESHVEGERFVLLAEHSGVSSYRTESADFGKERLYKAATTYTDLEDANALSFVNSGVRLKPLSPVHIRGHRDPEGNLSIQWIRRTRVGGEWQDGVNVRLGEESERYEMDILNGSTVVRTLHMEMPEAVYSSVDQVADFGVIQPEVTIEVYQLSAVVGRGFPRRAIL
ncbi:phage tail protein [Magnetococcales bacterium HHB-1]